MKTKLFFLTVLLAQLHCFAQAPAISWQKTLGGADYDDFKIIQQTSDGGYVMTGATKSNNGDVTGNHGDYDAWVIKLNALGTIEWEKTLGGTLDDRAYSIQQTIDGGYIMVGFTFSNDGDVTGNHGQSDAWIIKLNSTGVLQWQKTFGGTNADYFYSIQLTEDQGYIIGGNTYSNDGDVTFHTAGNSSDIWIVKLNNTGILQWQKTLGGTLSDNVSSIEQTTDGGYILSASTYSTDGNVSGNQGGVDAWIIKVDSMGILQWQKTFGGTLTDTAYSVKQTTDGGYIVAGYTNSTDGDVTGNHGQYDAWILKLDNSGILQWQKAIGGSLNDYSKSICQTADGGYIIAGDTKSVDGDVTNLHGNNIDAWIVKINSTGVIQWQKTLGGTNADAAQNIQKTADGGYIMVGHSTSNDGDIILNQGEQDAWILKLEADFLAIYNFEKESVLIFPNPSRNEINLQFPDQLVSDKIIITDLTGKVILEQSIKSNTVNTESLADGVYLIEAFSGDRKWQAKFLKN